MSYEKAPDPAAVMAERFIRSHDTETELRQFAYKVRDLARQRDNLAADLAAEREKVRRVESFRDECHTKASTYERRVPWMDLRNVAARLTAALAGEGASTGQM